MEYTNVNDKYSDSYPRAQVGLARHNQDKNWMHSAWQCPLCGEEAKTEHISEGGEWLGAKCGNGSCLYKFRVTEY